MKISFSIFLGLITLLLVSCASKPPEVERPREPRYIDTLVGKVVTYEADSGIVLIRLFGRLTPLENDVYLTRGSDGTEGNVQLSGQAKKYFLAAEYKGGTVANDDAVYRRRLNPRYDEKLDGGSAKSSKPEELPPVESGKVEGANVESNE